MIESPILIDVWTVEQEQRADLIEGIRRTVREVVVPHPGFVAARIYESGSGTCVVLSVQMRTAKDRQRLTDSLAAHEAVRKLRRLGRTHANVYRLIESFEGDSGAEQRG